MPPICTRHGCPCPDNINPIDFDITEQPPLTRADVQAEVRAELARRYQLEQRLAVEEKHLANYWRCHDFTADPERRLEQRRDIESLAVEIARLRAQLSK